METKTLRELVTLEKEGVRGLFFADTHERVNTSPASVGKPKVITWPSVYSPNSVEDNAPPTANLYMFCGAPRRTLSMPRNYEEVVVQYYHLAA